MSENEDKTTKLEFLQEKLDSFKEYIEKHATDKTQIETYKHMSLTKLIGLARLFFIPYKDDIDEMVSKILERTGMDDKHRDKIGQYLQCFIDTLEDN